MIDRTGCRARLHGYREEGCCCADAGTRERRNARRRLAWRGITPTPYEPPYVSPIGARRRVQALVAIGHTYMTIAAASGLGRQVVYRIAAGLTDKLMPETVDKVSTGFDALSTVPGACRGNVKLALQRGWAPPQEWDDIDDANEEVDYCAEDPDFVDGVLVERFLDGHAELHQLNNAEKDEAVRQMKAKGWGLNRISEWMKWNWGTTVRRAAA